jgi:hypothetical protein
MAQTSREWEQPAEDLRELVVEWPKSQCEDSDDADAQFNTVEKLNVEDRLWSKTVSG